MADLPPPSSRAALHRLRHWLSAALPDSAHVQSEATLEALARFRVFSGLAILVNLGYIGYFGWFVPAHIDVRWQTLRDTISTIHGMCATGMLVGLVLIHLALRQAEPRPLFRRGVQVLVAAWAMAFGICLTVADQWVGSNTTNYALLGLFVATLALLRPAVSIALFALSYAILYHALELTQADPDMLRVARSHSFSSTILCLVASLIMWRQFVLAALLRRQLRESNATLQRQRQEMAYLAAHDALTGLSNRGAFMEGAVQVLHRAGRYPSDTSILIADLDHFKRVNDQYGHPAGDAVLRHCATLLQAQLRETDIAARLGGEEFIALLPNTSTSGAVAVAEKIRNAIALAPALVDGQRIDITTSVGVSTLQAHHSCPLEVFYGQADLALYAAKHGGRNRVEYQDLAPMAATAQNQP